MKVCNGRRAKLFAICMNRTGRSFLLALLLLFSTACSTKHSVYASHLSHDQRTEKSVQNDIMVEVSALGLEESKSVFGLPLNDVGVQPIWIRVENNSESPRVLFPIASDPDYFPPYEVARRADSVSDKDVDELYEEISKRLIDIVILAGATQEGFLFTQPDEGMKAINIELQGIGVTEQHQFVVPVPGMPRDYFHINPERINADSRDKDLSADELHLWLEELPCCTYNKDGIPGDPLNIAFVGTLDQLRSALISRHWDVTAPLSKGSLWRMVSAFVFSSRYRYAPISPLYVFDREHDLAFQKSRAIIDQRMHLRLWHAPATYKGIPVWVGQISRDVDVKLSGRMWPPTTHVIDPDVDEARFYLIQDLMEGGKIAFLGYASGIEPASIENPNFNAENDPYFSDGLRGVFFLEERGKFAEHARLLEWRYPDKLKPLAEIIMAKRKKEGELTVVP